MKEVYQSSVDSANEENDPVIRMKISKNTTHLFTEKKLIESL